MSVLFSSRTLTLFVVLIVRSLVVIIFAFSIRFISATSIVDNRSLIVVGIR